MLSFCFQLIGEFDSQKLWQKIQTDNVNLTDLGETVWVYGKAPQPTLNRVIKECSKVGLLSGTISRISKGE